MYIISLIAGFCYTQLMAIITQGSLKKLREKMFRPHGGSADQVTLIPTVTATS